MRKNKKEKSVNIDFEREQRTLIPEIIFCENKSYEQVLSIAQSMYEKKKFVLGTRCSESVLKKLKRKFPSALISIKAKAFRIGKPLGKLESLSVGLISAGTTDLGVSEESAFVLESLGVTVKRIYDVGVAGIHRLLEKHKEILKCDVLIVYAGMEGALPSVVSGLFHQPLIAVPTSIGYGTALKGFTALFAMLTSCSPGVTVVNIDNGVGAAAAAFKILKAIDKSRR
ncbi:MAG: nickel pincer cofactor biosynthesis protein LarB [Ignavibacteria bacterium]|nr:nickel pincer cofactor biosynthesis protein LarB [Ignavibacteria bacterium]